VEASRMASHNLDHPFDLDWLCLDEQRQILE